MSKFGEPWTLNIYQDEFMWYTEILKSDGYPFYDGYNKDPIEDDSAERVVACVNALAGVENPEAVKELLDTVRLWHYLPKDDKTALPIVELAVIIAGSQIQFTEDAQ